MPQYVSSVWLLCDGCVCVCVCVCGCCGIGGDSRSREDWKEFHILGITEVILEYVSANTCHAARLNV